MPSSGCKNSRRLRQAFVPSLAAVQLPSGEPFAFAGLWDFWQKDYSGCTIITREAEGEIRDIHDRMPCALKPEAWENWLDPSYQDVHGLKKALHHCFDLFRFQSRYTGFRR